MKLIIKIDQVARTAVAMLLGSTPTTCNATLRRVSASANTTSWVECVNDVPSATGPSRTVSCATATYAARPRRSATRTRRSVSARRTFTAPPATPANPERSIWNNPIRADAANVSVSVKRRRALRPSCTDRR